MKEIYPGDMMLPMGLGMLRFIIGFMPIRLSPMITNPRVFPFEHVGIGRHGLFTAPAGFRCGLNEFVSCQGWLSPAHGSETSNEHVFDVQSRSTVLRVNFGRGYPLLHLAHGSSLRQIKVFGTHPFFAEIVHPLNENQRIGLLFVCNGAGHADRIPTKVRIPSRDKITGREPFRRGGPCRSVGHLRSPRFNGRILAWVCVGVNRIGIIGFIILLYLRGAFD